MSQLSLDPSREPISRSGKDQFRSTLDSQQSSISKSRKEKKERHFDKPPSLPKNEIGSGASGSKTSKEPDLNNGSNRESLPVILASPVPETLLCPIHKDVIDSPVIARCGHTFCRICIENHLHVDPRCPLDGVALQASPEFLFPNLAVAEQLRNLPIRCKHGLKLSKKKVWEMDPDGCPELIKLGQRDQHEDRCPYAIMTCPFCNSTPMKVRLLSIIHVTLILIALVASGSYSMSTRSSALSCRARTARPAAGS